MKPRARIIPVLLLLALAAADLLVPGLCLAEAPVPIPIAGDTSNTLPFESGLDDCFCCCAHVVPEHVQTWDRAVEEVPLLAQSASDAPPTSPTPLFRPPRA